MVQVPISQPDSSEALRRLVAIMAQLRDPERGCEWDIAQTLATIAPYTIEEAYEVADAIQRNDVSDIKNELGDLALQVVFQAQIAVEAGLFTLSDVLNGICDKLERRHPHLFGEGKHGAHYSWEEIKARERATQADKSALAGVALALPALERAAKLQRRAAHIGFDWPDASGARAKVVEELQELDEAPPATREEELGDLLFAVVNLARLLEIEPEEALRKASRKFERRFRAIETAPDFSGLSLNEKEALWAAVKATENASSFRG